MLICHDKVYTKSFCISTDKYNCTLTGKCKILEMRTLYTHTHTHTHTLSEHNYIVQFF